LVVRVCVHIFNIFVLAVLGIRRTHVCVLWIGCSSLVVHVLIVRAPVAHVAHGRLVSAEFVTIVKLIVVTITEPIVVTIAKLVVVTEFVTIVKLIVVTKFITIVKLIVTIVKAVVVIKFITITKLTVAIVELVSTECVAVVPVVAATHIIIL